jgi:predicted alpha/beta hydrolase
LQDLIEGLCLIAPPSAHSAAQLRNRVLIQTFDAFVRVARCAPHWVARLGPESASPKALREWFSWNLTGDFHGPDGFDYASRLADVSVPIMALLAEGDGFIAPPAACARFLDHFGSSSKAIHLCGKSTGHPETYGHARIVASRAATTHVWPIVLDWINQFRPAVMVRDLAAIEAEA